MQYPGGRFNGVKVFSATKHDQRAILGERITEWLASQPMQIDDISVTQSSDSSFHCVTITVFYTN
ncbi:MAG: hypothetical protein QM831_02830 [Kofleriaceae bacterium]